MSIEFLTTHNCKNLQDIYFNHSMAHYTLKAMKIYFLPKKTPHFADDAETIGISLGDILSFVTGLRNVPPIGFEKQIMVEFF